MAGHSKFSARVAQQYAPALSRRGLRRLGGLLACCLLAASAFGLASLHDGMLLYHYFIVPGVCFWGPGAIALLLWWMGCKTLAAWLPPRPDIWGWRRWRSRLAVVVTAVLLCAFALSMHRKVAWVGRGYGVGLSRGSLGVAWGSGGGVFWIPTDGSGARLGLNSSRGWRVRDPVAWWPELKLTGVHGASVPLWMLALLSLAMTLLVWWRDRCRFAPGFCQKCGYNLTGNVSGRCPECGTGVPAKT